jgi:hypothetical protein
MKTPYLPYKWLLCLSLFIIAIPSFAQKGLLIKEDQDVKAFVTQTQEKIKANEKVSSWRVQVLATNERSEVEAKQKVIEQKYPGKDVDWVHDRPVYKLRIGYFSTRVKAMELLYLLKVDFPSAFIVQDHQTHPRKLIQD